MKPEQDEVNTANNQIGERHLLPPAEPENSPEIQYLHEWMSKQGFIVHPALRIPQNFDGIQGIGTSSTIPHKTIILAVPSHTIITVSKCYEDPVLKPLFQSNDELFDYEADEEAEFNILCVYLMYHKMHIESSPCKAYLQTISLPETAVDWPDTQLVGLNKSLIEEILHVRRQCTKVEQQVCEYLRKHKYFQHLSALEIVDLFRLCYKSVLTRCFGYYFSTACLIPVADLMNHHCESVDHQLVHLDYERGEGLNHRYKSQKDKLDCELMGLSPPSKQLSLPFQLQYLVKNGIFEGDAAKLAELKVRDINDCINRHLSKQLNGKQSSEGADRLDLQDLDFCELDDQEDNDTQEDTEYNESKTLQRIIRQEKEQMHQFQQQYVQVRTYEDVEKQVGNKGPKHQQGHTSIDNQSGSTQRSETAQDPKTETTQDLKPESKTENISNQNSQQVQTADDASKNSNKAKITPNTHPNICPVEIVATSSESSDSDEEEWCLDPSCYFTMSTNSPVSAGSQLFTSYGSRTNRFLLVWYGFAYRDNLYDSVTLRMQALFSPTLPLAESLVLDTYIGGQGLCFKKNQTEQVRPEQVSKQFRLKRSNLSKGLIMYLRLFLLNYYKGQDLYKIFVTFPSSIEFQLFMFRYYRDIVQSLYHRFPAVVLKGLHQDHEQATNPTARKRVEFKIIYIQEQLKILDVNMEAVNAVIEILQRIKSRPGHQLDSSLYGNVDMGILRVLKDYLISLKQNCVSLSHAQIDQVPGVTTVQKSANCSTQTEIESKEWVDQNGTEQTK